MVTSMKEKLYWLMILTILFVVGIIYVEFKTTTFRTVDGGCQSLTVEDECD